MRLGKYLLFKNDKIEMRNDFSSHKCDFWNYTKNAEIAISNATSNVFNIILFIVSLTNSLIYYIYKW